MRLYRFLAMVSMFPGLFMWVEFFEDNSKRLSMPRLLVFLSFPPATIILAWIHTTEALSVYLGAYVLNYGLGKFGDAWENRGVHGKSRHIDPE